MFFRIVFLLILATNSFTVSGDDMNEREAISQEVRRLLKDSKFEELNGIANRYIEREERTSSGLWKLSAFYAGIEWEITRHFRKNDNLELMEELASQWQALDPKHPSPYFMQVKIIMNKAWEHRGRGYAKDVDEKNWKGFYGYLKQARRLLVNNKKILSKDPHWYELMIDIIRADKGARREEFNKILNEGMDRFPLFYEMYFAAVDYLTPKWHGSIEAIDELTLKAVAKTKKYKRTEVLARIYWYASQVESKYWFANDPKIWPLMSKAMDDVLLDYPDKWNLNNFAFFSCIAGDVKKTKELIKQMDGKVFSFVWKGQFQKCKQQGTLK